MPAEFKQVKRKLYCFRLSLTTKPSIGIFTWEDMFKQFSKYDKKNLFEIEDNNLLLLEVEEISKVAVKGHFSKLRYEWPLVKNTEVGTDRTIELDSYDNIMERAHFIYYPQESILVAEYNHYGTRTFGRFGEYISTCVPQIDECNLFVFMKKDSLQDAEGKKGRIRRGELAIEPPAIPLLEEVFGLDLDEVLNNEQIDKLDPHLSIQIKFSNGTKALPSGFQGAFSKLIDKFKKAENRNGFRVAKLKADQLVDLLGGDFFGETTVFALPENSRIVVSSSIYEGLDKFYHESVLKNLSKISAKG